LILWTFDPHALSSFLFPATSVSASATLVSSAEKAAIAECNNHGVEKTLTSSLWFSYCFFDYFFLLPRAVSSSLPCIWKLVLKWCSLTPLSLQPVPRMIKLGNLPTAMRFAATQ